MLTTSATMFRYPTLDLAYLVHEDSSGFNVLQRFLLDRSREERKGKEEETMNFHDDI